MCMSQDESLDPGRPLELVRVLLWHLFPFNLDNLHCENESVTAWDLGRPAPIAVGKVRGDIHLPLVALNHHLHGFCPALYHLVGSKGGWLPSVVGAVKLLAVHKSSLVVAFARRVDGRMRIAIALAQDFVLETAGKRDYALLLLVLLQEGRATGVAACRDGDRGNKDASRQQAEDSSAGHFDRRDDFPASLLSLQTEAYRLCVEAPCAGCVLSCFQSAAKHPS
mmetsp:Transcript_37416/g.105608  ORF Transcript_37416/g.105608 Transcript_37416/m.105608 type:complete len:223 (-) Transcript_37416:6-674(-)